MDHNSARNWWPWWVGLGKNTQLSTGNLGFSYAILRIDIHLPLWGYVIFIEKLAVSPGLKKKK